MLIQQITLPHLHETNLRQCWAYLVLTQNKKIVRLSIQDNSKDTLSVQLLTTTQSHCKQVNEPTYGGERERRGLRDVLRRFLGLTLRRRGLTGLREMLRLRPTRAGLRDTLLRRRATGLLERSLHSIPRTDFREVFM